MLTDLNKKPSRERLTEYGFTCQGDIYCFSTDIMGNMFSLNVSVTAEGSLRFQVMDKETNEEYTLVKAPGAVGAFVGAVRSECESIINDIVAKCFEPDIFKSEYARLIIRYIKDKYGADAEYLWEKFPNNAVFREQKTQKWYAALLTAKKSKLGIEGEGEIEILDLKDTPENICALVDGRAYLPGYHMNKKHWYTIPLNGAVPIEEIYRCIDISYVTVKKTNTKEKRKKL